MQVTTHLHKAISLQTGSIKTRCFNNIKLFIILRYKSKCISLRSPGWVWSVQCSELQRGPHSAAMSLTKVTEDFQLALFSS